MGLSPPFLSGFVRVWSEIDWSDNVQFFDYLAPLNGFEAFFFNKYFRHPIAE
jgi:hypothetical protein